MGVNSEGTEAIFLKPSDDFAHGLNERFPLANIGPGMKQWETVIRELAK